ncbi:MAG TPA: DUF1844 domain-containing protein [Syntrophales bacterium]|nr:DUF1844 domain-containing protein [Syntrophales bacterium]HPQ44778.1 DUF1844 domain-containing protein [Syntrophales bacterium]
MEEKESGKGFVIKDKRLFGEDGEARTDAAREAEKKEPEQKSETSDEHARDEETMERETYQLPEMNFHNFILSLYTSVMFNLGELADPVSNTTTKDLRAAKQTIDILGMLKEKTMGNLDASEKDLLDGVLAESRMRYVKGSEKS